MTVTHVRWDQISVVHGTATTATRIKTHTFNFKHGYSSHQQWMQEADGGGGDEWSQLFRLLYRHISPTKPSLSMPRTDSSVVVPSNHFTRIRHLWPAPMTCTTLPKRFWFFFIFPTTASPTAKFFPIFAVLPTNWLMHNVWIHLPRDTRWKIR